MATYDAGIVTAYGAAVRGGYTGTYEEFCAQQAGYAQSAAAVEQAKEDVQELVDSIPTDYTQLSEDVSTLKEDILDLQEEIEGGGTGMSQEFKTALHNILEKVAYIDEDGQDYLDALDSAMWPPKPATGISLNQSSLSFGTLGVTQQLTATVTPSDSSDRVVWTSSNSSVATVSNTGLVTSVAYGSATITATAGSVSDTCSVTIAQATLTSISAVYTQSGTVYDTASLDSLKNDLTVTATYSDSSTATVTNYTLSGTLSEGTSTITVSYGGKSATFDVTVSRDPSTLVNTVTGVTAPITMGSVTLTDGYINDSGDITSGSSNHLYNEFVEGNAFTIIDSSNAIKSFNYRTAGYDASKSFLGRNYKNANFGGGMYESASFMKMGFSGTAESTDAFLNLPYTLSDVCTIANTRISNTGEAQTNNSYYSSDFIPIETVGLGAISSFNSSSTAYVTGIAFYDANKQFISYSQAVSTGGSSGKAINVFEITSEMKYCRLTTSTPSLSATSLVIEGV